MADRKSAKKPVPKSTKSAPFTEEERAAMREYVQEKKSAARRGPSVDLEPELLAKLAAMGPEDRALGERLHAIVKANAPGLSPKLWYGMPAYANQQGQVVCFFQDARKFKSRYSTLGFTDKAALDDGEMWPAAFALKELTPAVEAKITELLKRATR